MFNRPSAGFLSARFLIAGLALGCLQAAAGERVPVGIYEFRSSVMELEARGATDMFVTALVNAGRYRVVERSQLDYGVMREKQLSASGQATGGADRKTLRGARYLIEGSITEASNGESGKHSNFSVAGLSIGRGKNKETLGIDVRVVDAATGDVVDSISLRKPLNGSSSSISGIGSAAATLLGKSLPYSPDASHESSRQDRLDGALRALIDAAVAELSERGTIR